MGHLLAKAVRSPLTGGARDNTDAVAVRRPARTAPRDARTRAHMHPCVCVHIKQVVGNKLF